MNWKKIVLIAGIIVVLLGVAIFLIYHFSHREKLIHQIDPKLTSEQLSPRQAEIDQLKQDIKQAEARNASKEDRFKLYTKLGSELLVIGKLDEAQDAYNKAVALIPDNPTAYQELFQVQLAMHAYREAERTIKKAVELNPASPDNWAQYLILERDFMKMSVDDRLKLAEQALPKTNRAAKVLNQYGLILEEKGQLLAAYNALREAVLADITNKEYADNLDRVNIKLQKSDMK